MHEISISTSKKQEIIDITNEIKEIVEKSDTKEGVCVVYTPHATAAIILNENYDPNLMIDTLDALNSIIPQGRWKHDKIDGNGAAHIKSSIIGPSESLIIKDGKLLLGQWQDIMLCEFDGPRQRRVLIKIIRG